MMYCGPLVERRLELFPHVTGLRIQKLEVGPLAGTVVEVPMTRAGKSQRATNSQKLFMRRW